jgi:membrane fusion protein (multidrug efflux system)
MTANVGQSEPMVVPAETAAGGHGHRREVLVLVAIAVIVLLVVVALVHHADGKVNRVALVAVPRPVSVVAARATTYSDSRKYVGVVESWIEASVGPQYISAYVSTVLVRPGDAVVPGQVLATLDCAHPNATSKAVQMQAKAIDQHQRAMSDQAAREASMLKGGFIGANQVEQTTAQSSSERAQLLESKARLVGASLDVHDCILKAPFEGEIATRTIDPGAFVRPGTTIVSVVDRSRVRVTVDAPEKDFAVAHIGAPVRIDMLSTGAKVDAIVSRRAPKADSATRTIHFEIDIADPRREYPTGTTAIVRIDVGHPVAAVVIPLYAATQQEGKASFFVVDGAVAHLREVPVLGERGGGLYFNPTALPANAQVVTEGRALLSDGDAVKPRTEPAQATGGQDAGARGGGFGRPL